MVSNSSPSRSARVCCGFGSQSTWKGVTCQAVGRCLVEDREDRRVGDDPAGFVEHVALEVHHRHRGEPGFVVMANELAQQISVLHRLALRHGLVRDSTIAIFHALPQCDRTAGIIPRPEADRPLQAIVGLEDERSFAVAPLGLVAQHVQHHAAQARIDAVVAPGTVGEVIGIAEGDAVQRIRHREHIAANVVGTLRAKLLDRRQGIALVLRRIAVARDSEYRAAKGVDHDA